ncbi:hypothetical protein EYR41_004299 [Orbilia oligospora]|uniref:Uncharacterized protein n=1 Tax=Orbilia oligospora TaxID=2813651 RepID=A0A8H2E801_ORBOL|nr:hypothetical protein EYR41_004299 [Orbilia oligospora]
MQFLSKIILIGLGLTGISNALPAPTETDSSPALRTGYLAPPPGLDTSKHKTPPKGFVPPKVVVDVSPADKASLQKRQSDPYVHVVLCDNWYFGGQCDDYTISPNGQPWILSWFGNMNDRTSSFKVYTNGNPGKVCQLYLDYYYDSYGNLKCSGSFFEVGATTYNWGYNDALQGGLNDAISCGLCWSY